MFKMCYFFLLTLFLLTGCLNPDNSNHTQKQTFLQFGHNYNHTDNKQPPLEEIAKWLGAPLPSSYSDLKYKILTDTPDPYVRIAVKVPEEYYKMLLKNPNLVKYDELKNQLASDIKPRNWSDSNNSEEFIKKPFDSTTIWVTKNQFYPKYIWYQNSTLYLVYSSR